MGTENCVLKGAKLKTNTKKQILKFQSIGWIFKNTILKKRRKKRNHKSYLKNIYMKFALKNSLFFGKVIIGYKNEKLKE